MTGITSHKPIRATVGVVHRDEKYVVGYAEQDFSCGGGDYPRGTMITFSFSAWKGRHLPRKLQVVELHEVQMFKKGMRASDACPIVAEPLAISHKESVV